MKCPMKKSYKNEIEHSYGAGGVTPKQQEAYFGNCDGQNCAWWDKDHSQCIVQQVNWIEAIVKKDNY